MPGGELTVTHAGGLGSTLPTRSEDVDRAPIKLGGWQVAHCAGIVGALATLGALYGRRRDGRGRAIDISLQEVVLALVAPLVPGPRYQGTTWSRVPDRPPAMGRLRARDGYIVLNAFDDHHFDAFREVMGRPEWCAGDEWKQTAYRAQHMMEIGEQLEAWMLEQAKDDIHHRAAKRQIPIGPISSAADVMANPQYAARSVWSEVDHPVAGRLRYLGRRTTCRLRPPASRVLRRCSASTTPRCAQRSGVSRPPRAARRCRVASGARRSRPIGCRSRAFASPSSAGCGRAPTPGCCSRASAPK